MLLPAAPDKLSTMCIGQVVVVLLALDPQMRSTDSLAEWSKALAPGASPKGRGFEPHSCHFHFCLPATANIFFFHEGVLAIGANQQQKRRWLAASRCCWHVCLNVFQERNSGDSAVGSA